jgi:hypothetical protein
MPYPKLHPNVPARFPFDEPGAPGSGDLSIRHKIPPAVPDAAPKGVAQGAIMPNAGAIGESSD